MPIKIFVADDHDVVREGVKSLLKSRPDWTVCGEATDGQGAIVGIRKTNPDVAVLDISMPEMSGLDVAARVSQINRELKILIFTMHDGKSLLNAARDAGAHGLVLKSNAARDLIRALQAIIDGGTFFEVPDQPAPKTRKKTGSGFSSLLFLVPDLLAA